MSNNELLFSVFSTISGGAIVILTYNNPSLQLVGFITIALGVGLIINHFRVKYWLLGIYKTVEIFGQIHVIRIKKQQIIQLCEGDVINAGYKGSSDPNIPKISKWKLEKKKGYIEFYEKIKPKENNN